MTDCSNKRYWMKMAKDVIFPDAFRSSIPLSFKRIDVSVLRIILDIQMILFPDVE